MPVWLPVDDACAYATVIPDTKSKKGNPLRRNIDDLTDEEGIRFVEALKLMMKKKGGKPSEVRNYQSNL